MNKTNTTQQEKFVEMFLLTGNAARAAEVAGYGSPKQRGYELKNKFKELIEDRQKRMLQDSVPIAINQLINLVQEAESEAVRLNAVKDLLDRGGFKPVDKVEQQVTTVEQKTTEELREEYEQLMRTIN
jgi:phage terminase small subunit